MLREDTFWEHRPVWRKQLLLHLLVSLLEELPAMQSQHNVHGVCGWECEVVKGVLAVSMHCMLQMKTSNMHACMHADTALGHKQRGMLIYWHAPRTALYGSLH